MILTDDDKVVAKELGLTLDEMRMAKATHIAPERYAFHKRELQAGRDADDAMMRRFAGAAAEGLEHAYRGGRGVALPPLEGDA